LKGKPMDAHNIGLPVIIFKWIVQGWMMAQSRMHDSGQSPFQERGLIRNQNRHDLRQFRSRGLWSSILSRIIRHEYYGLDSK
jgi:hypothetical protein